MGRHVAIVRIRGAIRTLETVSKEDYLPLGDLPSVRSALKNAFPTAEWSSQTCGLYHGVDNGLEFGIDFSTDGNESVDNIGLIISGPGDAGPAVMKLTKPNGWLAIDVSAAEFIDPDNPSV